MHLAFRRFHPGNNGALDAFEAINRIIAAEGDNKCVIQPTFRLKIADKTDMQDVKAAIGCHNRLTMLAYLTCSDFRASSTPP